MSLRALLLNSLMLCPFILPAVADEAAATPVPSESATQHDARMAWWRDARFGMFIHWGLYSVAAGEWNGNTGYGEWLLEETKMPVSTYSKFVSQFDPEKFDAKEWVRVAKQAGMKYLVITSKHHDGFCMYPSKYTDWCISSTPFKRDPLAELSAACKEAGIHFCTYHSIMDWHHSDWPTRRAWNDVATGKPDMDRFTEYLKNELTEIVTRYHPAIMWFDGEWEDPWTHERGVELFAYLRKLDPKLIINNRIDKRRTGMAGMNEGADAVGDYGTPEQEIPATGFGPGVDWESCMTLNDHWGYNKNDQKWKSTTTIIHNLVDIASKGGNYLLNVGPTSEGLFPSASIERLSQVGDWMKVNSDSIYGTTASPFKRLPWGRATQKSGKLYLHVFEWPQNGVLVVPMVGTVKNIHLLATPSSEIAATIVPEGISLAVGATAPDQYDSVIELTTKGTVQALVPTTTQAADGTVTLTPANSDTTGGIRITGEPAYLGYWNGDKDSASWQIIVNKPGTFTVSFTYGLLPKGNDNSFTLSIDSSVITGKLAAGASWEDFKTVAVGTVTIAKAGTFTLSVKPAAKPVEGLMNLRSITLVPVAH